MSEKDDKAGELYRTDAYLEKYPSLFEEGSAWKVGKIRPLLDVWMERSCCKGEVSVLDIGGGAGLILKACGEYLCERYGLAVRKLAMDLSPGMLAAQRRSNPDLAGSFEEGVESMSLGDKSVDLVLLIDVLEHVGDVEAALAELRRVSRYVLLKVPLEDHLLTNVTNWWNRGGTKAAQAAEMGHVNFFRAGTLRRQLVEHLGEVVHFSYSGAFAENRRSAVLRASMKGRLRLVNDFCAMVGTVWPGLAARIYTDFAMVLVRCGD